MSIRGEYARRSRERACEFNEPYSVAVRDRFLYVSERGGPLAILTRLNGLAASEPEVVQIVDSRTETDLSGICHDGSRLWCMGPPRGASPTLTPRQLCK